MVQRALEWVSGLELAPRMLTRLSGGQRQKVYLAMALAQMEVMGLARRLAEEGRAVVMVLHDLPLALRYAHRAALLWEGRVCQTGTPEQLYESDALERVMGVCLGRVETGEGWRYFYR